MLSNIQIIKRHVEDEANSPFIYGSLENAEQNLKKLILLQRFRMISPQYFAEQVAQVEDFVEELFNKSITAEAVNNTIKSKEVTDWLDSVTLSIDALQPNIENLTTLVNDAYVNDYSVKISCIRTNNLIRARVKSYNGEAFAVDILDVIGNCYTIDDIDIVNALTHKRKYTFDITYGLIECKSRDILDLGNTLLAFATNTSYNFSDISFIAYSDFTNMNSEVTFDAVDSYTLDSVNDWLLADRLNKTDKNTITIYVEIQKKDEVETQLFITNKNVIQFKFIVDTSTVELDKYSDELIQRLNIHTDDGDFGEIYFNYEIGTAQFQSGDELNLPFDIIKSKFNISTKGV